MLSLDTSGTSWYLWTCSVWRTPSGYTTSVSWSSSCRILTLNSRFLTESGILVYAKTEKSLPELDVFIVSSTKENLLATKSCKRAEVTGWRRNLHKYEEKPKGKGCAIRPTILHRRMPPTEKYIQKQNVYKS